MKLKPCHIGFIINIYSISNLRQVRCNYVLVSIYIKIPPPLLEFMDYLLACHGFGQYQRRLLSQSFGVTFFNSVTFLIAFFDYRNLTNLKQFRKNCI